MLALLLEDDRDRGGFARGSADDPGALGRAARPSLRRRARRNRGGGSRGQGLSRGFRCRARRCATVHRERVVGGARPQGARAPRPARLLRRAGVRLPTSADPRCSVRVDSEGGARSAPRTARALARAAGRAIAHWSSPRSSAITSSRPSSTSTSSVRRTTRPDISVVVQPSASGRPVAARSYAAT